MRWNAMTCVLALLSVTSGCAEETVAVRTAHELGFEAPGGPGQGGDDVDNDECDIDTPPPDVAPCWEPIDTSGQCPNLTGEGPFCEGEADAYAEAIKQLADCTREATACNNAYCDCCTDRATCGCIEEAREVLARGCDYGGCTAENCYFPTDPSEASCGQGQPSGSCTAEPPFDPRSCEGELECGPDGCPDPDTIADNPYCGMCGDEGQPTCDELGEALDAAQPEEPELCNGTIHAACIHTLRD